MTGKSAHSIQWTDVISLRPLTLLLMPFLVAVALVLVFASTLEGGRIETSAVGSHFRRETIVPVAVSSLFFFLATIAHVAWSQILRWRSIKHWVIYGITAWILLRAFWWLIHTLLQSPFLAVYSDRLSSVGGSFGIIFAVIMAITGLYISVRAALFDKHPKMMWGGIGFAAPFVAMVIAVTVTTSAGTMLYVYLFSDLWALSILGFGCWVFKLLSKHLSEPLDLKYESKPPSWSSKTRVFLIVAMITSILGVLSIIMHQQLDLNPIASLIINWFIVISGAFGAYSVLRKISKNNVSLQWIGLTVLMLLAIVTYPDQIYLEYPNRFDNAYLNDYARITSLVTFLPFGFWVMALFWVIGMLLHASTEIKTIFVGGMSVAPVMFALAQPELIMPGGKFDAMFVLAPTLVLIAVGVVMFGFFKPHNTQNEVTLGTLE